MSSKTVKTAIGCFVLLASTAFGFIALPKCNLDVWAFLTISLAYAIGGHLISNTQTKHFVANIILPIIRAWKGTPQN